MRDSGFKGKIYLVNPRGGEIEGHKVYPSIADLPDNIDQAVVTLPAAGTPDTVRALGKKGVEAIVLAASGFCRNRPDGRSPAAGSHRGHRGIRRPDYRAQHHGSHFGAGNYTSSFFPLANCAVAACPILPRPVISVAYPVRHILSGGKYGIARPAGWGTRADLDECDLLGFYDQDSETKSIFLYLESIKNPKRFLQVARRVSRNKPVFLLKGGASG